TDDQRRHVRKERTQYRAQRRFAARILAKNQRVPLKRHIAGSGATFEPPDVLYRNEPLQHRVSFSSLTTKPRSFPIQIRSTLPAYAKASYYLTYVWILPLQVWTAKRKNG